MSSTDVCRYCHSDIQLHMSGITLSQLRMLITFSLKFARMVEGENSFQFKAAMYWDNLLSDVYADFSVSCRDNVPVIKELRTYYD